VAKDRVKIEVHDRRVKIDVRGKSLAELPILVERLSSADCADSTCFTAANSVTPRRSPVRTTTLLKVLGKLGALGTRVTDKSASLLRFIRSILR